MEMLGFSSTNDRYFLEIGSSEENDVTQFTALRKSEGSVRYIGTKGVYISLQGVRLWLKIWNDLLFIFQNFCLYSEEDGRI
jgi:hypothetical protein